MRLQVRVSALPASGRPYDRWRPHTCARLASRVGSATSAGQLSEGGPTWRSGHHLPYHSSSPGKTFSRCLMRVLKMGLVLSFLARGGFGLVPSGSSWAGQTEQELRNLNGAEADPTERGLGNLNSAGADPIEHELGNLNGATRADPIEHGLGNGAGADSTERGLGNLNGAARADPTERGLENGVGADPTDSCITSTRQAPVIWCFVLQTLFTNSCITAMQLSRHKQPRT
ncbi:hypothetical protein BHM03_00036397 [Ensete ventricosum]|nr:hypothetical protein BHM03_00036397 [Ensete ventricosum]